MAISFDGAVSMSRDEPLPFTSFFIYIRVFSLSLCTNVFNRIDINKFLNLN
ncbi:hypothetical protein THIOM_002627 [Candidatus Thiomargarita nelsonii]|uniref:Uncharacterized protein n=1 Tax=Candidatus Thiomargarita nelsonii TaxID=1003181 RepID=A0A176S0Y3_9GAMM|nr:hypothetical protein THIOM_002627 [Candidatus Thiomargarita nelsonii]